MSSYTENEYNPRSGSRSKETKPTPWVSMRSLTNIKSLTSLTLNKAYAVTAAGLMELARLPALKELEYDCMFSGSDTVKALELHAPTSSSWSGVAFLAQESSAS
jgi:hypothetical protein